MIKEIYNERISLKRYKYEKDNKKREEVSSHPKTAGGQTITFSSHLFLEVTHLLINSSSS
jgi:hypothetical protein